MARKKRSVLDAYSPATKRVRGEQLGIEQDDGDDEDQDNQHNTQEAADDSGQPVRKSTRQRRAPSRSLVEESDNENDDAEPPDTTGQHAADSKMTPSKSTANKSGSRKKKT